MKGIYCLIMRLERADSIKIGKLGTIDFKKGYYIYVGSALNSLEHRLKRHLAVKKKLHWHIDYLLQNARVIEIPYHETDEKIECMVAGILQKKFESIKGFGSSDCKCKSHLFFASKRPTLSLEDHTRYACSGARLDKKL